MAQNGTVAAYFSSMPAAQSAISALTEAGFSRSAIGLAAKQAGSTQGSETSGSDGQDTGVWDKVKNFFSGDAAEPYSGETASSGDENRLLGGDTYGHEDVHGSLNGLELEEGRSKYFGHRFGGAGEGAIVTVRAQGQEAEAQRILEQAGGDVGSTAAEYEYGDSGLTAAEQQNIRLYGEVLRVHKDRVRAGEVRLRKEVRTTTQTIEVPVTHEELVIERVAASGEQPATGATFQDQEIRIPLTEERAVVEKQPVLREEVRVGKKDVSGVETFNEQVRSEDLKVEEDVLGSQKRA